MQKKNLAYLIVALGVAFRLYYFAFNPSVWGDEASLANNIIERDIYKLCTQALNNNQAAPPGYLFFEKIIGSFFGYSEPSLRFFALLSGVGALFVFHRTTNLLSDSWAGLTALAFFSLSSFLIYHSAEVKQYSTEVLASTIVLYFAVKFRHHLSYKDALMWGVVFSFCILFSNPSIFMLAGTFSVLFLHSLVRKKYSFFRGLLLCSFLWSATFLVYYWLVLSVNSNVKDLIATWSTEFFPLPTDKISMRWYLKKTVLTFNNPLGLSIDTDFLPYIYIRWRYVICFCYAGFVMTIVGGYVWWKKSRYILAILLLPFLLTIVASFLNRYPIHERFLLFLVPSFYLLFAKALELHTLFDDKHWIVRYKPNYVLAAISFAYVWVNLSTKLANPSKFGGSLKFSEFREAINYINTNSEGQTPVYLSWNSTRFYAYYSRTKGFQWNVIYGKPPETGVRSQEEIEDNIRKIISFDLQGHKKAWFLLQSRAYPFPFANSQNQTVSIPMPAERIYYKVLQENATILKTFSGNPVKAYLVEFKKPKVR
jgi:hypothetical protein